MYFDAARFAVSWLAVANTVAKDKDRPQFDRRIGVHWYHGQGVRLVGTDGLLLTSVWVPEIDWDPVGDVPGPSLLHEADEVCVVTDLDGRTKSLMTHVVGRVLQAQKEIDKESFGWPSDVEFRVEMFRKRRDPNQAMFPGMEMPDDTVIDFEQSESITLPTSDARLLGWEQMAADRLDIPGEPAAGLVLNVKMVEKFGQLGKVLNRITMGAASNLSFEFDGDTGQIVARSYHLPGLVCFGMPAKVQLADVYDFDGRHDIDADTGTGDGSDDDGGGLVGGQMLRLNFDRSDVVDTDTIDVQETCEDTDEEEVTEYDPDDGGPSVFFHRLSGEVVPQ